MASYSLLTSHGWLSLVAEWIRLFTVSSPWPCQLSGQSHHSFALWWHCILADRSIVLIGTLLQHQLKSLWSLKQNCHCLRQSVGVEGHFVMNDRFVDLFAVRTDNDYKWLWFYGYDRNALCCVYKTVPLLPGIITDVLLHQDITPTYLNFWNEKTRMVFQSLAEPRFWIFFYTSDSSTRIDVLSVNSKHLCPDL